MNREVLGQALGVLNPHHIIGSLFRFECQHGSYERELVGTILGYEISDECPLKLTVSNRSIWGAELNGLVYIDGVWHARVDLDQDKFKGTLKLLK